MRLHRLTMTAFGPFATTQVVDFDALAAGGLFLLHGATGAGKTSVLDAVCFALYGQVPGARAGARLRVRSDHAADDLAPSVVLEATVGGRRLEVSRRPEWVRPKRRGAGTTTQPASTHVREWVDGAWAGLTTRNDEAAQLLLDLLGMGHEQFTKVVLLPQGDFAAFLRADAEQRRVLLSRLFDIDRFAGAESWLADERRRLAAAVEDADRRVAELLARAGEAFAGLPETDETDESAGGAPSWVPDDLGELKPAQRSGVLLERATALARSAQVRLESGTELAAAARARLADATDLAARRLRWSVATAQLADLDAVSEGHDEAVRRLTAARRSAPVAGLLAAADATARRLASAQDAVETAVERFRDLHPRRRATSEAVQLVVTHHREVLAALTAAEGRVADLADLRARHAALTAERRDAHERLAGARSSREQAATDLADARTAQQAVAVAAADVEPAAEAQRAAAELVSLVEALARAHVEHGAAELARAAAVDVDQAAREHLLAVREQRLESYAGELAAGLADGDACLVCGSTVHPALAPRGPAHVGRQQEADALAAAETSRLARARADHYLARLDARVVELLDRTGGADEPAARAALASAQARLAAAEQARADCVRQTAAATAAEAGRAAAEAEVQRWGAVEAQCSAALVEVGEQVSTLAGELDGLRGKDADVASRAARVREALAAAEALLDARAVVEAADAVLAEQLQHLAVALDECGVADAATARGDLLPPAQLAALADVVDERERARGDLVAVLAAADLRGVAGLPEPDLAETRAAVAVADASLQRSASSAALARDAVRRLGELHRQLVAAQDSDAPLREHHQRADELAGCVAGTGGGNTLRMRLSAYVLAARLEEVAAAATERLGAMSDGRYALVHSDERAKGGGRSGLGLRVVDAWTGVERDTATLSGGESFLASLALALGLADVVQAEAGGGVIETLFVDEGFGSLDEETLEEVMAVLDDLRGGGRAVGLVSHVADLRARIPSQLEVRKTRTGSTLHLHAPA